MSRTLDHPPDPNQSRWYPVRDRAVVGALLASAASTGYMAWYFTAWAFERPHPGVLAVGLAFGVDLSAAFVLYATAYLLIRGQKL